MTKYFLLASILLSFAFADGPGKKHWKKWHKKRIDKINIKSIELFTIRNQILKSSMGFIGVLHPGEIFILDITIKI